MFTGKTFNSVCFGAAFNFTAELYPTHLRATGVGIGSSVARLGGILSPIGFGLEWSIQIKNLFTEALIFQHHKFGAKKL